jgi:hypothetical protein
VHANARTMDMTMIDLDWQLIFYQLRTSFYFPAVELTFGVKLKACK